MLNVKSEEIYELIKKKSIKLNEINNEIEILKETYITQFKREKSSQPQLCSMVDFHKVWLESMNKEDKHNKESEYNVFMGILKSHIFSKDTFKKLKNIELIMQGYDQIGLDMRFTYNKKEYIFEMPNYNNIVNFDAPNKLTYTLDSKDGYIVNVEYRYNDFIDLTNRLEKDLLELDKKISENKELGEK